MEVRLSNSRKRDAHNTFDRPDQVRAEAFDDLRVTAAGLEFTIPPCSVLHLAVEIKESAS